MSISFRTQIDPELVPNQPAVIKGMTNDGVVVPPPACGTGMVWCTDYCGAMHGCGMRVADGAHLRALCIKCY